MSTVTQLKQLVHDLVDTSSSTFSDPRMVRGLNKAQDKIVNLILQKDTLDQWDDIAYTDLAEGFLDIVSTQNNYNLREDENFANLLAIHKIYILGSATATDYAELEKTGKVNTVGTGIPTSYRINGKTVIFNITPDYSATNGMKIMFTRTPSPILTSDTTREIGIPVTFHHLLALHTAYDFARAKRMDNANDLLRECKEEEIALGLHIGRQDFNSNIVITTESVDSR